MYISKIKIKNFRNYEDYTFEFDPHVNIITGDNAQGKTNLIEAIYMCSFAKSFRTRKDFETIRFGCEEAKIFSEINTQDNINEIEICIRKEGKFIKSDGIKITKMIDLLDKVYAVIFSPEDLKLVKESPEKRRRFINRELSKLKPSYYDSLVKYRKILKQRNTYLRNDEIQSDILSIWDSQLAYYGEDIITKRKEFIKKLEEVSSEIHTNITKGKEKLSLEYEPDIKGDFLNEIDQNKDILRGTTLRGPHRDDFKICINNIDIRNFGSQGQQRTAALSLKMAEIKLIKEITGEDAILLLDDVLSELDISRQEYLINIIDNVQVFITAADISELLMEKMNKGKIFNIEGGKVINV